MDTTILKQQDAIEKLQDYIRNIVMDKDEGVEDKVDTIKDLLEDIKLIEDNDWEWVAIVECPMAVSEITVRQVKIL